MKRELRQRAGGVLRGDVEAGRVADCARAPKLEQRTSRLRAGVPGSKQNRRSGRRRLQNEARAIAILGELARPRQGAEVADDGGAAPDLAPAG